MNKDQANKALRFGAYLAFFQAVVSVVVVTYAVRNNWRDDIGALFNDPANFIDVGIFLIFGIGMLRKSRIAAACAFIYMSLTLVVLFLEVGVVSGLPFRLVFIYLYFRAAQGGFTLRKLEIEENPDARGMSKWKKLGIAAISISFATILVFVILAQIGFLTPTAIQTGEQMDDELRAEFEQNSVLLPDEIVEFYYLMGLTDPMEEGVLLTETALLYYWKNGDDEVNVYEYGFAYIANAEEISRDSVWGFVTYEIVDSDGQMMLQFSISSELQLNKDFIAALRNHIATPI